MSDLMLYGVLKMPHEMAMASELSRLQYWQRAQEAADRLEKAEAELERLRAQEPVAWHDDEWDCAYTAVELDGGTAEGLTPLYRAAPPAQPAQRLTEWDRIAIILKANQETRDLGLTPGHLNWAAHIARVIESAIVPQWQPIETAPQDGREILMTNGVNVSSGQWFAGDNGTCDYDGAPNCDERDAGWMDWSGGMQPDPTHWMPLPAAQKD